MSGGLIGGVVGGVIGFTMGNPQLGWLAGSTLGNLVSGGNKTAGGPELADLRPQSSEYGRPIPIIYGTMGVGGNVIWASDFVKTSDGDGGGGKGGGGGGGTGPRYAANFAVLVCDSPGGIATLGRIWAGPDKRLIYDGATIESGTLRFYNGAEDQLPDPLIESYLGAGNVPAYRGYAYVVIEMFDITEHDGNRIPFLTVEIGAKGQRLGYVWPETAWLKDGNIVLAHGPGQGGIIVQGSAPPHTFVAAYTYGIGQVADYSARFFDPHRNRIVTFPGAPLRAFYVLPLDSGIIESHVIAEPPDLVTGLPARSPYAGSACYHDGKYIFAMRQGGPAPATIYGVDPETFDTLFVYVYSGCPSGMLDFIAAPADDSAGYVIGLNNNEAMKFPVASAGDATSMGTIAPPETAFSGVIFTVDPVTWYLWTAKLVLSTSTSFTWTVHDPVAGTKLHEATVTLGFTFHPMGFLYIPGQGMFCYGLAVLYDGFLKFDPETFELLDQYIGSYQGVTPIKTMLWDPTRSVIMAFRDNYAGGTVAESSTTPAETPLETWFIGATEVTPQGQRLSEVVTDLSVRAGLRPDQFDTSALTDMVNGYTIANQVSVKDAVSALMPAYYFDCVEDQGLLRFIKRGGDLSVEIPDDDLGAHASDEDVVDLYETTRGMDEELPRTLSVNYILAATKYSPATKYARRLIGYSGDEARLEMAMVFTDTKAAEIAAVNLHGQWISRIAYKLSLGRKYSHLMPTDLVGVQGYVMRLTRQTTKDNGVIEFEAVRDDSDIYTPVVIVEETPPPDQSVEVPVATLLELM